MHYTGCMLIEQIIYRVCRRIISDVRQLLSCMVTHITFRGNGVSYSSFRSNGTPFVFVSKGGEMLVGENFAMNNGVHGNPIGCYEKCTFFVGAQARLTIGNNVGVSQCSLVAIADLFIGDYVKIGGGSMVFTTDFHSLDPKTRRGKDDIMKRASAPVIIEDNAFIGARSIILKGVTIGANSIIGAGSVVTKSIPANEIWAGNPAKFIRKV